MLIFITIDELWDCKSRGRGRAIPREKGGEKSVFLKLRERNLNE
jgi:hypothetical protein